MKRRKFGKLVGAAAVVVALPAVAKAKPSLTPWVPSLDQKYPRCFTRGYETTRDDLTFMVFADNEDPSEPSGHVVYEIYQVQSARDRLLVGRIGRIPVNPEMGYYFASIKVPDNAKLGHYICRWSVVRDGVEECHIEQPFKVVSRDIQNFAHRLRGYD